MIQDRSFKKQVNWNFWAPPVLFLLLLIIEKQALGTFYTSWLYGLILIFVGILYSLRYRLFQPAILFCLAGITLWHYVLAAHFETSIPMLRYMGFDIPDGPHKLPFSMVTWIINLLVKSLHKNLQQRNIDATLVKYAESSTKVALRIVLIIGIIGLLGFETTSFAALIAAVGLAIGIAWAGLLANFAAGVFLVFLRPFKVGDVVNAGNATGVVVEIGLFSTAINTPDNVRVFVGNNAIFSGNIQNYSANPYRRVDLTAQLAHNVDPADAIQRLRAKIEAIPNVLKSPAPDIEILTFNERGTVLAIRPYCANANYWQVYFDTNKTIVDIGSEGGYGTPEQRVAVRNIQ